MYVLGLSFAGIPNTISDDSAETDPYTPRCADGAAGPSTAWSTGPTVLRAIGAWSGIHPQPFNNTPWFEAR
jgi:hypothetical protein